MPGACEVAHRADERGTRMRVQNSKTESAQQRPRSPCPSPTHSLAPTPYGSLFSGGLCSKCAAPSCLESLLSPLLSPHTPLALPKSLSFLTTDGGKNADRFHSQRLLGACGTQSWGAELGELGGRSAPPCHPLKTIYDKGKCVLPGMLARHSI